MKEDERGNIQIWHLLLLVRQGSVLGPTLSTLHLRTWLIYCSSKRKRDVDNLKHMLRLRKITVPPYRPTVLGPIVRHSWNAIMCRHTVSMSQ